LQQAPEAPRSEKKNGYLSILGVGVAAVAGVVMWSMFSGDDSDDAPRAPDKPREFSSFAAEIACEDAVRDRLKSPSTADFPDTTARKESGTFDVRGVVDSQNTFGATVRTVFGCTVTPIDADRYTITVGELAES
jgi:hypothetical protein